MSSYKYLNHIKLAPDRSKTNPRYEALDALRGLAALGVVFFHFVVYFDETYGFGQWNVSEWFLYEPLEALRYGPHFFYMISGFVILMTIDRTRSASVFIKSRLIRIMPAFLVALSLATVVTYLWGSDIIHVRLIDVFINALFLQGLVNRPHIDPAYWSLLVEIAFYMMAASLMYGAQLRSKISWVLWVWLGMTYFEIIFWQKIDGVMAKVLDEIFIVEYSMYFIVGIVLYLTHKNRKMAMNHKILLVLSIPVILTGIPMPFGFYLTPMILVLWLAIKGKLDWLLAYRPFLWLGALSFPLYVIHQNIGTVLIHNMIKHGISDIWSVLSATALSLFLAQIIYSLIETPAQKWLKDRYF
jgi:peptidoglycan/LPS O-acetylase OafA/YrhL